MIEDEINNPLERISNEDYAILKALIGSSAWLTLKKVILQDLNLMLNELSREKDHNTIYTLQGRIAAHRVWLNLPDAMVRQKENAKNRRDPKRKPPRNTKRQDRGH